MQTNEMTYRVRTIAAVIVAVLLSGTISAAEPQGYYSRVVNQQGDGILAALYETIKGHTDVGYDGLYTVYPTSDVRPGTNEVWDMYSTCTFVHGQNKCGSYRQVCDCYNREHSVPQSWFNGSPMKSDAFHVIPTDGKVNNQRGNHPLGECSGGTYLSSQATGKLGQSTFAGYTGTVFEVADEYKGDFARAYFYMVARYRTVALNGSDGSVMFTRNNGITGLTPYAMNLMMKWHRQDPVSQKELDRNEAIYQYQHNRNPFIDHPCLAEYIWGTLQGQRVTAETIDNCDGSLPPDTTATDTTTTPIVLPEFRLEPVTDIHANSAILHWTSANAASYTVDVYEKSVSGVPEVVILNSAAGNGAQKSGYTQTGEENGVGEPAIRLGSGSQTGALIYTGLNFTTDGEVRIRARQYKTDSNARLAISIGTVRDTILTTASDAVYVIPVPAQNGAQTLRIETLQNKQRVFIFSVEAVTGGEVTVVSHENGYPMNVGNVLQHQVTGLQPNTVYYYTVTPTDMPSSEEGVFYTEAGWTGHTFVPFPDWEYRLEDGAIALSGMPAGATLRIWDAQGRMLYYVPRLSEPDLRLNLPRGLILIQLNDKEKSQTIKLIQ